MMKFILKERETKEWMSFTFQIKPDDHKRLAAVAKKHGLSSAEVLRQAIHFILEPAEQK